MSTTPTDQVELGAVNQSEDAGEGGSEEPETDRRTVRECVIDAVGGGGDLGEYAVEGAATGDDQAVMWFPDSETDPLDIPVAEFTGDVEWDIGYTEPFADDDETVAVLGITAGDKRHVINADKLEAVAYELNERNDEEVRISDLLADARINTDYTEYPVLFDLEDGRLMIAPILSANWEEDVRDTR
jgi:hypothetical protein